MQRRRLSVWILIFLLLTGALGLWRYREWREHRFDGEILSAAGRYGVDPALVKAVAWRESWFNPGARGRAGEFGLMQIRAGAAREWAGAEGLHGFAPEQLLDASTNALAGAWYLGRLLKRYRGADNPLPYALADYNAGRTRVLQWNQGAAATNSAVFIEGISFPATRRYVRSVLRRYDRYRPNFPEAKP